MKHADTELRSEAFARHFGTLLREARQRRRLRHYATPPFGLRQLRAAERGTLPLDAPTVNALASRYGVDLGSVFPRRRPLVIANGVLTVEDESERFDPELPGSLYDAFLTLVRRARGLAQHDTVVLRSEDIAALAAAEDRSYVHVLHELTKRMGVEHRDRIAMAEMLVSGADVAGVAALT